MATTINPTIVTLNTIVTAAPKPSQLQQSCAVISVGATTLTTGDYQYCGTLAAVEALFVTPSAGNQTELQNMATSFFAQGNAVGLYVLELGVIASPDAGVLALATWITDNPGIFYSYLPPADWDTIPPPATPVVTTTSGGTLAARTYYVKIAYTNGSSTIGATSIEVTQPIAADFLANVASPAAFTGATGYNVYIGITTGAETLQTVTPITIGTPWTEPSSGLISGTAPPVTLAALAAEYASPSSKTYFFVTTSSINIPAYAGTKSVFAVVPSPAAQSTEFAAAAFLYQWSAQVPSAAAPAVPMAYRQLYGVTQWPISGQTAVVQTILTAYGNIAYSGVEGGLTGTYSFKGTTQDGTQAMFWYAVDWFQIQVKQAMAAAIINGSNSLRPIVYNQQGINSLLTVAQNVANSSISFGLNLSAIVTAQSFGSYTTQNPSDYAAGKYGGFAATVTPQLGFLTITFNIDALQFAS